MCECVFLSRPPCECVSWFLPKCNTVVFLFDRFVCLHSNCCSILLVCACVCVLNFFWIIRWLAFQNKFSLFFCRHKFVRKPAKMATTTKNNSEFITYSKSFNYICVCECLRRSCDVHNWAANETKKEETKYLTQHPRIVSIKWATSA